MNYLEWLSKETPTKWWHDSAIPSEIADAVKNGALGVTTNPVLTYKALQADPELWAPEVAKIPADVVGTERVEALLKIVATNAADQFKKVYTGTNGKHGYALGQVNPALASDTDAMLAQGLRYASWRENIAVKVPSVRSSLPVVEELASRGIAVCTTLNFSVSQAVSAAEAYERGCRKAREHGIPVKPCFVVQQGGRLDEYLLDVALDNHLDVTEDDIHNAGNAVCKRSYQLLTEMGSGALIMPAGLRGVHHIASMAGANMVFSLQARVQKMVNEADPPHVERIREEIPKEIIDRLMRIDEFVRAYEPGALPEDDFIKFGVTQKTLSQFLWTGWAPLETYGTNAKSGRWF